MITMSDDSPTVDLVRRAKTGDAQAWNALVERYAPLIWSICRQYHLGRADADDVGQNVWLKLVRQLDKVRDPAALAGWLATTTRHECGRVGRAARNPCTAHYVLDAETIPDPQGGMAEDELLLAERHSALREAFADLPPRCQRLIALLIADPPVPYGEISTRLGIPIGSIGPTRGRCLAKLRRHPSLAALIHGEADRNFDSARHVAAISPGPLPHEQGIRSPTYLSMSECHAQGRVLREAPSAALSDAAASSDFKLPGRQGEPPHRKTS
jgi:RNA polymerase sigma factor (sigma-70 family)